MSDAKTEIFELNRPTLEGLAYRMLGSLAEAQDLVQDTFLKWNEADANSIENARAWLIKVCSRLALNQIRSARSRRETYVGTWLPEPFLISSGQEIAEQMEVDETVSVALMLTLERLTPAERAVYLLFEVFDYSYDEISRIVGKSVVNCRRIGSRARARIHDGKPRFRTTPAEHEKFLRLFLAAARHGDLEQFKEVLADSVELYADGGGKVKALTGILRGAENVAEFFTRIWKQYALDSTAVQIKFQWFNGGPGILIMEDNQPRTAMTMDIGPDGIQNIYAVRNPDKLTWFSE